MTTYKPGEEWKGTLNENTFLKTLVEELQATIVQHLDTIDELHQEIRLMQETADQEDEILDEAIDSITDTETWYNQPGETPLHKLI